MSVSQRFNVIDKIKSKKRSFSCYDKSKCLQWKRSIAGCLITSSAVILHLTTDTKSALQVTGELHLFDKWLTWLQAQEQKGSREISLSSATCCTSALYYSSMYVESSLIRPLQNCLIPCCSSIWLISACLFMFWVPASSPLVVFLILPAFTLVTSLTNYHVNCL